MRSLAVLLTLLVATLGLAACGGKSKEDKAKDTVCSARDDIKKQVDTLKGLTLSTATTQKVKDSLTAIGEDLNKIKGAQGDLGGSTKSQVQDANKTFEASIKNIASSLGSSTSLNDAKAQLTAALQQLATSYQQSFARVDCG